jgi:AcrR family transcriptional regulator
LARANYMTASARKRQVAEVAIRLIAKYGVQGTTVSRIAEAAGVSESGLYRHFKSRHEILLAALDSVYDRIAEFFVFSSDDPVPERLRSIGKRHSNLVGSGKGTFLYAFFEFVASPPELGLRDEMAARQSTIIDILTSLVDDGKTQGSVRPDVDATLVAWELHGIYWSEDITHLMGLRSYIGDGLSNAQLNQIIERISVPSDMELNRPIG